MGHRKDGDEVHRERGSEVSIGYISPIGFSVVRVRGPPVSGQCRRRLTGSQNISTAK